MYDMTPPQPTQFVPPPTKQRLTVPQIMIIVAALGVLIAGLILGLNNVLGQPAARYAQITADTIGSRYTGDCLIIRDETPYDAEGVTSVDYVAEEGTMVYMGTTICNVYSSGFSTREMTTLQNYRDDIKKYQMELLDSQIATDSRLEKLESDVLTRAREVRDIISGTRGNLSNQEKLLNAAIQARQSYLKEKYGNDQRMTRLYDEEQSQLQRISSWTKQYAALSAGVVSFYSDGYEYGLTVNNYDQFTPAEVRNMINGRKPEKSTLQKGKTTIYRMVRDGYWYVLMLIKDSNWNPIDGATYELRLENFKDTNVYATVISSARTGGELLVRLSVQSDVQQVLYVRTCTGVLGDSVSSLTVPEKAIYYQADMPGQEKIPGVVLSEDGYEWFVPVNILGKRDGMCFIAAIQQGVLKEGQTVKLFNN